MMIPMRGLTPWLIALGAAAAAGAAVTLDSRFLAVEAVLLLMLATLIYPGSRWRLAPLVIIVISPAIFVDSLGQSLPNGDAVQKSVLIVVLACLILSAGARWSAVGATAITAVGVAGLVSFMNVGGDVEVGGWTVTRALTGYALPWLFLFVDWRRVGLSSGLAFLGRLPAWCLLAGVLLQIAGVTTLLRIEDTGVPRLQGASIPAHLAMLSLVALAAGLCLLALPGVDRNPRTYLWVGLNLVILIGTATRGPIVVGVALVFAFVAHALLLNRTVSRRVRSGAVLISGVLVAALFAAAPELIRRSMGNSYEGTFNTSGRDQAWEFFYGLATQNPLTGKGLGFATVAVELYLPPHVQRQFVAPHNEYIHLVLDGGLFFCVALLAAMIVLFYLAARAHSGTVRWVITTFGVGALFYSYVDNTFSTPQFTVLVVILLGLLAANPALPTRTAMAERAGRLPVAAGQT